MADDPTKRMYRRDDPETSRIAAGKIYERLNVLQRIVLDYVIRRGPAGFTHEEAIKAFDRYGPSTIRTRVAELCDFGLVKDSGRRKLHPPNEREFIIWRFVPLEERAAEAAAPSDQPDLFRS
jgi:hypothetical protein